MTPGDKTPSIVPDGTHGEAIGIIDGVAEVWEQ